MNGKRARGADTLSRNLALAVASLLVFFVLAEGLASLLGRSERGPTPGLRNAVTGFGLRPNHTFTEVGGAEVRTNRDGFRDAEVTADRPAGSLRILAVGDSSTFGYGVARRETWVERLERSLAARLPDRSVEIINAGTPGWSSGNGAAFLAEQGLSWNPDLVIVSFGYNEQLGSGPGAPHYDYDPGRRRVLFHPLGDAVRQPIEPLHEAGLSPRSPPESFSDRFRDFPRRLKLYALMERWLDAIRQGFYRVTGALKSSDLAGRFLRDAYRRDPERIYGPLRVPVKGNHVLESYVEHLEAIVKLCRDAGTAVVFLLQPRRAYREFVDFLPEADRRANLESIALMRAGRADAAVEILSPRHAARPGDAITAFHLGVAYHLAGRYAEARPLLEEVLPVRSFTMNALTLMTAGRLGVPVVAATLPLAERDQGGLYFPDRYHVRAPGYALIAEEVEKRLVEEGLLEPGSGARALLSRPRGFRASAAGGSFVPAPRPRRRPAPEGAGANSPEGRSVGRTG